MSDEFDRTIADGLRHRAQSMPVTPLGFADVEHRIARRRQRTATFAAAAVMVPAVVGLGYLVGRRDDRPASFGAPETTIEATATTSPNPASYRCQGEVADDGVYTYYQYCEYIESAPVTTTFVTVPFATTTTLSGEIPREALLVVDASGGLPVEQILSSRASLQYATLPGTRTVEQTMVVPIGDDTTIASQLLQYLPVGGFDTWDPSLIDGPVPEGVTAVLVVGTDALDFFVPTPTTVVDQLPCTTPPFPPTTPPGLTPTTVSC